MGVDYWSGLVEWFENTLAQNGAIAGDDLKLFKLLDDVAQIPSDIKRYYKAAGHAGFKIPDQKAFKDSEFLAEYKKIIREDFEPVMPEDVEKAVREVPRDPEVNELVKKLSGAGPMPPR